MNLFSNLLLAFSITDCLLIIDIFKHKDIKNGVIFHCYDKFNVNAVHKILNNHDLFVTSSRIYRNATYNVTKYYPKVGIVIHAGCEGWTSVLDSSNISFQGYTFVIITQELSETTNIFSRYPVEVDSDVIIALEKNRTYNLYEVYNTGFKFDGTYNIRRIGHWCSQLFIKESSRRDLQGVTVKTAVIILASPKVANQTIEQYMEKPIRSQIDVDIVHRMKFFFMLKHMRDMYNISYDLHRVSTWGYLHNGSFDGMVGALYRGMAEIGGAPIFYRIDRAQHVQYISEYPGGFYTIYTRPLSDMVWFCVIAMLVLTAIILWGMLLVQNHRDNEDSSLSYAGLLIWGAICQQGSFINRESTSTKLVIFITFVYAVTLYQYYNATIVSSLLLKPPRNIRTLKDLLHSDLKAGVHDIVYDKDYFKRTTDPVAIQLYHKKVATATQYNFFTPEQGMAMVKKGGFAFHIDTTSAFPLIKATFTEREICETNLVLLYPLQQMGIVVRKNTPYKEHIAYRFLDLLKNEHLQKFTARYWETSCVSDILPDTLSTSARLDIAGFSIRRMYEVGLPSRIQSEVDVPMPACAHTPDSSIFSVGIREFSTPLLALMIGVVMSLIVFICEIIVSKLTFEFRH